VELKTVSVRCPPDANVIIGQSHFIKTVEDIHELLVGSVPGAKFGLAFCEASGPCLVRHSGNDPELENIAVENARSIGAGHSFVVILRDCYPVNVLTRLKDVPEVCGVFCATANPVEVVVAETAAGRGILGVIDGASPKGIEGPADMADRHAFLRRIGYKL
jgi:adenosine/AMP kinase